MINTIWIICLRTYSFERCTSDHSDWTIFFFANFDPCRSRRRLSHLLMCSVLYCSCMEFLFSLDFKSVCCLEWRWRRLVLCTAGGSYSIIFFIKYLLKVFYRSTPVKHIHLCLFLSRKWWVYYGLLFCLWIKYWMCGECSGTCGRCLVSKIFFLHYITDSAMGSVVWRFLFYSDCMLLFDRRAWVLNLIWKWFYCVMCWIR